MNDNRKSLDSAKGILILLIVLGHNVLITQQTPHLRDILYNWHVLAFFLITFLLPFRALSEHFLRDRFVRYFIPFAIFTILCALVTKLSRSASVYDSLQHLADLGIALAVGSASLLDQAAGARLFWFLPALIGLTVIRWLSVIIGPSGRYFLVALGIVGFLVGGAAPPELVDHVPFGLLIASYVVLPGLLISWLVQKFDNWGARETLVGFFVSAFIAAIFTVISLHQETRLILASMHVYSIREPISLVIHAIIAVAATLAVVLFCKVSGGSESLALLGRHSLVIYLTHQIIYTALQGVAVKLGGGIYSGLLLYATTVFLALGTATLISHVRVLRYLITPRDWRDIKMAFEISKRRILTPGN